MLSGYVYTLCYCIELLRYLRCAGYGGGTCWIGALYLMTDALVGGPGLGVQITTTEIHRISKNTSHPRSNV
jgi:hypothetical protein